MVEGKRILVTGASGALGGAVVRSLDSAFARVAAVVRGGEEAERIGRFVSDRVRPVGLVDGDWKRAVDDGASFWGGLDGLVLVAGGFAASGPFEKASLDELGSMLDSNLRTATDTAHAALRHMASGSIVAVGARRGETLEPGALAYAVSKAAVHAFVRGLAKETKARGVRVNAVLPLTIDTPANRAAMPDADFSRWTKPEAIADVMTFLLSDASRAVTGALIPV